MPNAEAIRWFKTQFQAPIAAAVTGTVFDLDMLTAIACQETGPTWGSLQRKGLPTAQILALCVGDTLDEDRGRRAFPRTQAALLAAPQGPQMFTIARQALVDMALHVPSYQDAASNPDKFCHGFGVFQRDLQFFLTDPGYFLTRAYEGFAATLDQCLGELRRGLRKLGFQDRTAITDFEFACVAIAYNTGGFTPAKGLKQGHFNGQRFYGEQVFDFLRLARSLTQDTTAAVGQAIIPPPTPVSATGVALVVNTRLAPLRLRTTPDVSTPTQKNVLAHLPDGHAVRAVAARAVNGFREVETALFGAHLRGFAATKFLKLAPEVAAVVPAAVPAPAPAIPAVLMPRRSGSITRRREPAGAHSLNEAGQPGRVAVTPAALVAELGRIIDWLDVENPAHVRYQPGGGLTFCNIYAHDYCHLAGAYLPRVWWTQSAIRALTLGQVVTPLYGDTIEEVRANGLFRWLRDFGADFGWRQTGNLDSLQQTANQGGIGLIVARRTEEGRSGHIVMIAPETADATARRHTAGAVTAPLQSQAGSSNFRRGTGRPAWWNGAEFAESAFWIHG